MENLQKNFTVHFVCRGNMHRSRLAEAYFKSLALQGFTVSSSGVAAERYITPPSSKSAYTEIVLGHHPSLRKHMGKLRTQSSREDLGSYDVVVCLDKSVFDDAVRWFELDPRKAQIWHVADIDQRVAREGTTLDDKASITRLEADTFSEIRRKCDELAEYLTHTSWVDVVNADNQLTGLRLPLAWATDRGLWHRGVHVVVRTSDGKYVVGKRSNTIVFAPGMLEITLGGGVDSGETPLQAAVRETHEELGVCVPEKYFRPLFTATQQSYHPHYHKRSRVHLYVYAVTLPVHSARLRPQPEEVAELRVLSPGQVRRLLHEHRLKHFGRLTWGYKLSAQAVAPARHAG